MEIKLREMIKNQKGTVTKILATSELGRRIRDLGITTGVELKIVGKAPLRDPVALKVRDSIMTLRNNEADFIYVNVENNLRPDRPIKVAVAGNPNCGKTTLFNGLAGTNYHVANYPGITVDTKIAEIQHRNRQIELIDLPGTYSLTAYSMEEKVARDFILKENPDIVLQVVDASNIERNLYLTIQLLELGVPVLIALNMVDVAEKRNIIIDGDKLSKALGLTVVKTVARREKGKEELLNAIVEFKAPSKLEIEHFSYGEDIDHLLDELHEKIIENNFLIDSFPPKWTALKYIENDEQVKEMGEKNLETHKNLIKKIDVLEQHTLSTMNTYAEATIADYRYGMVSSILKDVVKRKDTNIDRVFLSDKIDSVLTHKLMGPLILLATLYFAYQFTFWASEYPTELLESFFGLISSHLDSMLADGLIKSFLISGIIDGVGGVLGFTPLIMFMFFVIAILEDSGYMARVAYMMDKIFRLFGMQGNSVVPYIISGGIAGGCAVPGVMATRTIKGAKERLLTMLTVPFMPCGAKVPVFAMLISAFFTGNKGLLMLGITILSWISAFMAAKLMSVTIIKTEASSFIMELPPYRFPTLKGLFLHAWERTWMYIKKAGTIILAISILLWIFMTFPQMPESQIQTNEPAKIEQEALRYSAAGRVGIMLEPVSKYAGFDWRTNIALLGGIAAKEVVISTLGTAYSLGEVDPENTDSLAERLSKDPNWTMGTAIAFLLFTIMYSPCFITIVVISKESGSWKWGAFTLFGYALMAYIVAVIAYQIF